MKQCQRVQLAVKEEQNLINISVIAESSYSVQLDIEDICKVANTAAGNVVRLSTILDYNMRDIILSLFQFMFFFGLILIPLLHLDWVINEQGTYGVMRDILLSLLQFIFFFEVILTALLLLDLVIARLRTPTLSKKSGKEG